MNRILFLCPCDNTPYGGIHVIYENVDILNKNNFNAYVLHEVDNFRCTWFANNTKILYFKDVLINFENDILVIPEIYGPNILNIVPGVKKVIFNQGAYLTFSRFGANYNEKSPYLSDEIIGIISISQDNKEYLEYTFKDKIINRIINCIEYYGINPNYESKNKVISIIEKNNIQDFIQIINILKIRDNLKGYTFDIIKNETHQNVLQRLEKSKIYISLSDEEGFGLSAAEAMAMGCVVIGYHGQGAKEYFKEEFSYRVEQGDVIDICKKVEEVIELIENRNEEYLSKVKKAREFILANYSKEQQKKSVVETWTDILTRL